MTDDAMMTDKLRARRMNKLRTNVYNFLRKPNFLRRLRGLLDVRRAERLDVRTGGRLNISHGGRLALLFRFLFCLSVAAATAVACGWMGTEHSVRFNSWMSEREMARLPPLPSKADEPSEYPSQAQTASATPNLDDEDLKYEQGKQRGEEIDALWASADEARGRGDLKALRQILLAYLERTAMSRQGWVEPTDRQPRRNSAFDQLDALDGLQRGASASAVNAYLAARLAFDSCANGEEQAGGTSQSADDAKPESSDEPSQAASTATDNATTEGAPTDNATTGGSTTDGEATESAATDNTSAQAQTAQSSTEASEVAQSSTEDVRRMLDAAPRDRNLADNVAYLRAALLYKEARAEEAAQAFQLVAARYPMSEKREAALYMAALAALKTSMLYTASSGDPEHLRASGGHWDADKYVEAPPSPLEPPDDAWRTARSGFERVMREYPRGRYTRDARGWLAYLLLRAGDRAGALVEYYRLLADERDASARVEASFSLTLVRHHASDEEMRRVETALADDPRAALAYAYHNLYNYAIDPGCQSSPSYAHYPPSDTDDWETKQEYARWQRLRVGEKERIVEFAARMLRRYPHARGLSGGFALRVAGASLELERNRDALEQARRALSLGVSGQEHARALWVKGVAEHRLGDYTAARRTLTALLAEQPHGELTEGARRFLAMAAEDAGDLDAALEQYLALQYTSDAAYFLDVLMSPQQLEGFIARHPAHPLRDEFLYSLGVCYMRLGQYDKARAAYAQVHTHESESAESHAYDEDCMKTAERGSYYCLNPKTPDDYNEAQRAVRPAWVSRDLKTMDDLERLEHAADEAQGDEAKAEALYQLASYHYEASELLFYNPAAWQGGRFNALYYNQQLRAPGEQQLMRRYMEQHEPLVRALDIYLQTARLYPQTRAARDALYTAAVIHERLANFQLYWPEQYRMGMYPGERLVSYRDVRRAYPRYHLPPATYGWQPSTRSANGSTLWSAPPKPTPPPTRLQLARRRIQRVVRVASMLWQLSGELAGGRVRRWTLVLLWSCVLLLVLRLTRRARRFLFAQIAHRLPRVANDGAILCAPSSSYAAYAPLAPAERARRAASRLAVQAWQLVRDRRIRAALLLNLVTHGLLTALAWALVSALRAG